jgi:hypothetical protein
MRMPEGDPAQSQAFGKCCWRGKPAARDGSKPMVGAKLMLYMRPRAQMSRGRARAMDNHAPPGPPLGGAGRRAARRAFAWAQSELHPRQSLLCAEAFLETGSPSLLYTS